MFENFSKIPAPQSDPEIVARKIKQAAGNDKHTKFLQHALWPGVEHLSNRHALGEDSDMRADRVLKILHCSRVPMRCLVPGWHLLLGLCISCAAPRVAPTIVVQAIVPAQKPVATRAITLAPPTPTPVPADFRVIAYVTDAIVESVIPYPKLTHINPSFNRP